MRRYGTTHVVGIRSDGSEVYSRWPQSEADAIKQDVCRWEPYPHEWCEACRSNYLIYTKTGLRNCCAGHDATAAYHEGFALGDPVDATEAIKRGLDYYIVPEQGRFCGHIGKLTLDGKCWLCSRLAARDKSPRQAAIAAGSAWYNPDPGDLCRKCGTWARRRISNSACEECERIEAAARAAAAELIQNKYPDMIMSREDAKIWGLKVYRTGEACRRGHAGWRYLSNNGCLDCK